MGLGCPVQTPSPNCTNGMDSRRTEIWAGRLLFVGCLTAVAAVLGFLSHRILTEAETSLTEAHFESISDRALTEAHNNLRRIRWSSITMSSIVAELFPDSDEWPFVAVPGFEHIVNNLLSTSGDEVMGFAPGGELMGFAPFVNPDQLTEWENFAYAYYENVRKFPNGTAVNSFGKGVWGVDKNSTAPDQRYRDTDGTTTWGSKNKILVPALQYKMLGRTLLFGRFLLFNLHSEKVRGEAIDNLVECSNKLASQHPDEEFDIFKCGVLTDFFPLFKENGHPGSMIFQPIYPANDRTKIVGIIPEGFIWERVMENGFPRDANGIDCVLETEHQILTYTVRNGSIIYVDSGDHHQRKYSGFKRSIHLTSDDLYADPVPRYILSLYPNETFYASNSTRNPFVATVGSVCIIIFTTLAFFIYDYFVRREFSAKKDLLEAKRRFIRFISHEVRTPLNAACMGLEVMHAELTSTLGLNSSTLIFNNMNKVDQEEASKNNETKLTEGNDSQCISGQTMEWLKLLIDVQASTQNAVAVLDEVLNYDKIERRSLNLEKRLILVWQLIELSLKEFELSASIKSIRIMASYDIEDEVTHADLEMERRHPKATLPDRAQNLRFVGDPVRLRQALANLLSNAIKFSSDGSTVYFKASWEDRNNEASKVPVVETTVELDGERVTAYRNGYLKLSVTDTGAGMTSDQLQRLFTEGVQFNANELQAGRGSGLGLHITKGIVEQHSGTITATSEGLKKGATFTITLPLYTVPESVSISNSDVTKPDCVDLDKNTQRGVFSDLRVLIVDDVLSNRKLLNRLLTNLGNYCEEAEDGEVAVEMVKNAMSISKPYDAILLDYEMPVTNGPQAADRIRRMGCDSTIIGVTGNMLPEDVAYFRSSGANGVMPKPVKIKTLEKMWAEFKSSFDSGELFGVRTLEM